MGAAARAKVALFKMTGLQLIRYRPHWIWRLLPLVFSACLLTVSPAISASRQSATAVEDRLDRAEALLRLGVSENGASRSFEQALALVDAAAEALPSVGSEERAPLTRQVDAVRQEATAFLELYRERFFGAFPLARLMIPTLLSDEGFAVTEQLFHPPEVAALESAARQLMRGIDRDVFPLLFIRVAAGEEGLEALAAEVFLRKGPAPPVSRRQLLQTLSADDLAAFDRGAIDPTLVDRLLTGFGGASVMIVTVAEPVEIEASTVSIVLEADLFETGELIQGSPVNASVALLTARFVSFGAARDRRLELLPILLVQLSMFGLAMLWATRIEWSLSTSSKLLYRFMIGLALFCFGRAFIVVAVHFLQRVIPPATALAIAAWWWPAAVGIVAVLLGGVVAWFGSAQLTDILPQARAERAVGAMFGLTALGAASYFVAPLLLLDGTRGLLNFVPFVLASLGLSMLFGFAVRTGPPIPQYFILGPLLAAPLVGVALLLTSPSKLWLMVGVTALMWATAWARHRYAVSHGIEETGLSPDEAASADQERLVKLGDSLKKRL